MIRDSFLSIIFISLIHSLPAQNLVPNSSFEKVNEVLNRWVAADYVFESRIEDWVTPNEGSPDILSNKIVAKMMPPRKGVDLSPHRARTGEMMVAIKTYGCEVFSQHCKEYLQVKLKEPIQRGEDYFIEFWVNPMQTSLYANNIGMAFSDVEIQENSEYGLYFFDPAVNEKTIIKSAPNDWYRISATVTADDTYDYILIGNFLTDDETDIQQEADDIKYSYYLIDDVLVRPLKRLPEEELNTTNLAVGDNLRLNNILFETAKATLIKTSFKELDQLVKALTDHPEMTIQINGHTDNQGTSDYNLELSQKRAMAVLNYLSSKGIQKERMQSQGFGESQPVLKNDSPENQELNRRVEIIVLTK